jgi:hypothetical protein
MASSTKQLALVTELIDQTRAGRLRWEKSSVRGAYMVAFPESAIRILGNSSSIPGIYYLNVFDGAGNVLVDITNSPFHTSTSDEQPTRLQLSALLAQLYQEILQVTEAEDQDKVIDNVLTNLRQHATEDIKAS